MSKTLAEIAPQRKAANQVQRIEFVRAPRHTMIAKQTVKLLRDH